MRRLVRKLPLHYEISQGCEHFSEALSSYFYKFLQDFPMLSRKIEHDQR